MERLIKVQHIFAKKIAKQFGLQFERVTRVIQNACILRDGFAEDIILILTVTLLYFFFPSHPSKLLLRGNGDQISLLDQIGHLQATIKMSGVD